VSRTTRRARLEMEQLESRQLLSVTISPNKVNVHSFNSRSDRFTIRLISDTADAQSLLSGGVPLVVTVTDAAGNVRVVESGGGVFKNIRFKDFNHDGITDIEWQFRRNFLKGLTPGTATVDVSDTANPEAAAATATTGTTTTGTTTTGTTTGTTSTEAAAVFESTTLEIRS
jgi:hypothetical protein